MSDEPFESPLIEEIFQKWLKELRETAYAAGYEGVFNPDPEVWRAAFLEQRVDHKKPVEFTFNWWVACKNSIEHQVKERDERQRLQGVFRKLIRYRFEPKSAMHVRAK